MPSPGAESGGAGRRRDPVSDAEIAAFGRAIPEFIHALKAAGPPAAPLRERLMSGALGPRHVNALHVVAVDGPMNVSALAARLDVALPTASLMVGELSRSGLLQRAEDPDDHRRTIVRVAPEVEEAVRDFVQRRLDPLRRALARLSAGERRALLAGLRVLGEEWQATAAPQGDCPGKSRT